MNRGLRTSRLRIGRVHEDVNPMEGVVNIVDAMLVFACGLMLSLIINWNVDIGQEDMVEMSQGQEVTNKAFMDGYTTLFRSVQDNLIESENEGNAFEKMGTVYKDPATGKLFMLTK